MSKNTIIRCDEIVGCRLLKYLDGLDAINFIEAVDSSEQFGSIAKAFDHHFITLISMFCNYQRLILPHTLWQCFIDDTKIDEEQLVIVSTHYSSFIQPSERLYIYPCFSLEGFSKLCEAYRTSLFKCYARLLPLNTVWYYGDFGVLDYEWYSQTVGLKRTLNDYEKHLFRGKAFTMKNMTSKIRTRKLIVVKTTFPAVDDRSHRKNMIFVRTVDEFKMNLEVRFLSGSWLKSIDFSKFIVAGGCVLNALCKLPFPDTKEQDINLIYYMDNLSDFEITVQTTIDDLKKTVSSNSTDAIKIEKVPGSSCYNVFLPCNIRLNFSTRSIGNSKQPISHILHNFDIDISQVAFTGNKIIFTLPFLQALASRSFIVYTLHAESPKYLCTRIVKYCKRGFDLLLPISFDGDLESILAQEEIPLYRVEHKKSIDDEGEICIATKESYRAFARNIDTFRLQEKFMSNVCPQLLQYK